MFNFSSKISALLPGPPICNSKFYYFHTFFTPALFWMQNMIFDLMA